MMNVTGELLSKMSMEDLDKLFQQMKHPTQEQKESAWKKMDTGIYDEIITVGDDHAFEVSKELAKKEGILTGISSGAALHAAIELAKRSENAGKTIVALLPDSGDRYYSTPLFVNSPAQAK